MAPTAAAAAAMRNSEQKIRRHDDDVNEDAGFGFVIIDLLMLFFARPAVSAVIERSGFPAFAC
jgi:hypothetical protein